MELLTSDEGPLADEVARLVLAGMILGFILEQSERTKEIQRSLPQTRDVQRHRSPRDEPRAGPEKQFRRKAAKMVHRRS